MYDVIEESSFEVDRGQGPIGAVLWQVPTAETASDASRVVARVMYHVQWNDEIFPRAGQFALFDGLASSDRRLVAFPGPHAGSTDAVLTTWCRFLTEKLLDSSGR